MKSYRAPWGRTLRIISLVGVAILFGVYGVAAAAGHHGDGKLIALIVGVLIGAGLCIVRGYRIEVGELIIERLLWTTQVPLDQLRSASYEPDAMAGSMRLWGNGGLFSFTGWFRNSALGTYRAYVTDLHRTVVLRFYDRKIVVSPDAPEAFVAELQAKR